MKLHGIEIDRGRLAEFCQTNGIREVLFFGSITRDDFRPDSDIDVIVEFLPGQKPDLFAFAGVQVELGELLGRVVHLHTEAMIDPRVRGRIRQSAVTAYAA